MRRFFHSTFFKLLLLFAALFCGIFFGFRGRTGLVYVEKRMSAAIGSPVTIRSIVYSPLSTFYLRDVTIGKSDAGKAGKPFFTAERAKLSLRPHGSILNAEGARICFTEENGLFPGVFDTTHPDKLTASVLDYFREASSRMGTLRFFLKDAVVTIPTERGTLTLPGVSWERRVVCLKPHNPKMINVALDERYFRGESVWATPVLIVNNLSVAGVSTLLEEGRVSNHPVFLLHNIWQTPLGDSWFDQSGAPSDSTVEKQDNSVPEPEKEASPSSCESLSGGDQASEDPVEERGGAETPVEAPAEMPAKAPAETPAEAPVETPADKPDAETPVEASAEVQTSSSSGGSGESEAVSTDPSK